MTTHDQPHARRVILLGSTGSIGVNALEVVRHLRESGQASFDVVGLAAGSSAAMLAAQAQAFDVDHVALAERDGLSELNADRPVRVFTGHDSAEALIDAVARPGDLVVGAMVGSAGVPATIKAIDRGCDVALANKETLVAAGAIVMPRVRERGVDLIPIDSEHSAIFQCLLAGRSIDEVRRLVITASGGPFRTWSPEQVARASVSDALNHPTWNMGRKVTIDSATLMNKALEVIEAHWLFGLPAEQIQVIVHRQSLIHSFVEFVDGSVLAQLGPPDMRLPIQYALTWPGRRDGCARRMDWSSLRQMDFEPLDHERFAAVKLASRVIETGGTSGAIFNAANEAAVALFLEEQIPFPRITELVAEALDAIEPTPVQSLDDVAQADRAARTFVLERAAAAAGPSGSAHVAGLRGGR